MLCFYLTVTKKKKNSASLNELFSNSYYPKSQIIVGGVASTPQDVSLYASCSLLAASMKCDGQHKSNEETNNKGAIEACVEWLMENEFISIQKDGEGTATIATVSCSITYCVM